MNIRLLIVTGTFLIAGGWSVIGQTNPAHTVSGVVMNEEGEPVAGAVVRVQTTGNAVHAGKDGTFTITLPDANLYLLTAWAQGYFNADPVEVTTGQTDVHLVLEAHADADNKGYRWLSAYSNEGNDLNCENCHAASPDNPASPLPFDEWAADVHAKSVNNPRFLTMYKGTDVNGNASPPTVYVYKNDYGKTPLPADLSQPYFGPGYLLDFPDSTGNCATCHAPLAAVNAPYETNPLLLAGVPAEGISCDFCHKIWDITLNLEDGLPYTNMPGVLSYTFRRPAKDTQFFAGPFDDVAPGKDTYSPLQRESAFCASCHYGVFWGTVIYNSFGEWLASPYSDASTGKTCQDCHMPPGQSSFIADSAVGGLERNPQTIFTHRMPGATDETLLQNTATLTLTTERRADQLLVTINVENTRAGHHIPTDSPLRQILLVVAAVGRDGQPLTLEAGPTLPDWAGDLAGQPGRYYAKLLEQMWTGVFPTAAYWTPVRVREDTRLPALYVDTSFYTFIVPADAEAVVSARLLLRRAYAEVMQEKGWNMPDMLMEQAEVVSPEPN